MLYEAQIAYHFGYDEHKALAALTTVPANALALGHRIGRLAWTHYFIAAYLSPYKIKTSIEPGKDADLVIWERHPLRLGARPKQVIVDGIELDFAASWNKQVDDTDDISQFNMDTTDINSESHHLLPKPSTETMRLEDHGLDNPMIMEEACAPSTDSFVLRNISRLHMGPGQTYHGSVYLIVENGKVACAGEECDRDHIEWPSSSPVFEMGGAVVIPVKILFCVCVYNMAPQTELLYRASYRREFQLDWEKFCQSQARWMAMQKTMSEIQNCHSV